MHGPAKKDARDPARRELSARLARTEAQLLAEAGGKRWDELSQSRLVLTVALAMLEREPADLTVVVDELVARAEQRIEQRERERDMRSKADSEDRRKRERERVAKEERDDRLSERLGGVGGEAGPNRGGKQGGCDPGDPLCGDWDGRPEAPPPPPITGAERPAPEQPSEDKPKGGVHAARVLPSSHASESEVTALVERHTERLTACVPHTQRASGMRIEVRVRVDGRGRFREPRVIAADVDPRVSSCIAEVFRAMKLEGSEGDSRVVTVPLWLPPDR